MRLNFENLLISGKIERVEKEERGFDKIENDLKSAENLFNSDSFEWAMSIAYQAVLRASMNFMASLGYRAIGREHHKNTFEFMRSSGFSEDLVDFFDRVRIKRNEFLYRGSDEVSSEEAQEVIENARRFVLEIRTFVLESRTEEK